MTEPDTIRECRALIPTLQRHKGPAIDYGEGCYKTGGVKFEPLFLKKGGGNRFTLSRGWSRWGGGGGLGGLGGGGWGGWGGGGCRSDQQSFHVVPSPLPVIYGHSLAYTCNAYG